MITRTFSFLDGIGRQTEAKLQEAGISTWNDFVAAPKIQFMPDTTKKAYDNSIKKAIENLQVLNHTYFCYALPKSEHWRLYNHFKDYCGFLDIETTGLSPFRNKITTISIWNRRNVTTLIRGQNLTARNLKSELSKYKMLVTFNGQTFDIPFIRSKFPSLAFDQPHMDLRWTTKQLGLSGGLKVIEEELGISREDEVKDISGLQAVRLWKEWEIYQDKAALDLLVKYNQRDVINLEKLADIVYKKLGNEIRSIHRTC